MGATMQMWSPQHIAALALSAAVTVVLVWVARRHGEACLRVTGRALALTILAAYACEHAVYAVRGIWTAQVNLPLHLTDAVTLVSIVALWRPDIAQLVELLYFWALAASLQAVLTPDLGYAFPDPLFFTYFVTHAGAVAAACMLVFGARRAPRAGAVLRVYAATLGFAVLAGIGTMLTGGNYMYLRRKPSSASLLDVMGPWPAYVLAAAALALLLFAVLAMAARVMTGAPARRPAGPARGSPGAVVGQLADAAPAPGRRPTKDRAAEVTPPGLTDQPSRHRRPGRGAR